MQNDNITLVKNYFKHFLGGDQQSAFSLLDEHVYREVAGAQNVPTVGIRRGKAQVASFFEMFHQNFSPKQFTPQHFFPKGDEVFVVGHFTHMVKPTKKEVSSDWLIKFSITNGKIGSYKILEDSYALHQAFL